MQGRLVDRQGCLVERKFCLSPIVGILLTDQFYSPHDENSARDEPGPVPPGSNPAESKSPSPIPVPKSPKPAPAASPISDTDIIDFGNHPYRGDWPSWMTDAVNALLSISAEGENYRWKKIVWNWTLFERMLGYPEGGRVCVFYSKLKKLVI
jgi:hypothetical protein